MRIGLFGGTFNPIHYGHLRTTLEVKETFGLDKIHFIPSAIPPHKASERIAGAKNRFEMIRLAISDRADFIVSDVELDRPGPSYSIDTVHHFQTHLPENIELFLIMGLDAFLEIDTWKAYQEFFDMVPFIVMNRREERRFPEETIHDLVDRFLKTKISNGYSFSASQNCYSHQKKQRVFLADVTALDISSTKIRQYIMKGKSIQYLVPERVLRYIEAKGLYR
jgi:nicotinate-nucleotide adenylyltransferase